MQSMNFWTPKRSSRTVSKHVWPENIFILVGDDRTLTHDVTPFSHLQDRRDSLTDSQQFLPSFGPLFGHLGHSRPPRLYQEPADYLAELNPSYLQTASASNRESAMLGSGNFGVIPGGTYYSAGESSAVQSDPYLYDGNSHGRPHRYVQRHRVKYDNYNNRR